MKTYKISHIPAGFMPKVWTILFDMIDPVW